MKNAQIHRSRGLVAIALPGPGPTVYLSPDEAQKIARFLNACARDIKARAFIDSQFHTQHVDIDTKQP